MSQLGLALDTGRRCPVGCGHPYHASGCPVPECPCYVVSTPADLERFRADWAAMKAEHGLGSMALPSWPRHSCVERPREVCGVCEVLIADAEERR